MNKDNKLMQVQPDEQFLKNYQAVYYSMNAKPDCKSKVFTKKVVVEMDDLQNLNRKIVEKFKAHYENAGFMINVTVSFSDNSNVEFNSWTTFEEHDWVDKRVIRNVTIKWEYNAKLPQYPLPQKHSLVVRLADEISPEEMLNLVVTGKLEEMNQLEQEVCPIVARVDFINSMLAEELLNIVAEWQEGLASRDYEKSSFFRFIKKFRRAIAYFINYLTLYVAIAYSIKYFEGVVDNLKAKTIGDLSIDAFGNLLTCAIILIVLCFIVDKIFGVVANIVFVSLGNHNNHHIFSITKGDKNKCYEIESKLKKNKAKIILNLILTLLFNVLCSIIANNIHIFK